MRQVLELICKAPASRATLLFQLGAVSAPDVE